MTNERRFGPYDPEFAILKLARNYFNRPFGNDSSGLNSAIVVFKEQHKKVMPPVQDRNQFFKLVSERSPIIKITEQMAMSALDADDYEAALLTANRLYAYAEAETQDEISGSGEMLGLALNVHKEMAYKIKDVFSAKDPYLRFAGDQVFIDAALAGQRGDGFTELGILRGVIHMVAYNGTLGRHAREKFDPMAIVKF